MAANTKDVSKLTPPELPGPDATDDQKAEFERQRIEYEQARADAQAEAAAKSPQVQSAK